MQTFKEDKKNPGKRYCVIHGMGDHCTRYCKEVRWKENEALSRGQGSKKANSISLNETPDLLKEIKKGYAYLTLSNNALQGKNFKNPFYITLFFGEKPVKTLLDTGADVSVINRKYLP